MQNRNQNCGIAQKRNYGSAYDKRQERQGLETLIVDRCEYCILSDSIQSTLYYNPLYPGLFEEEAGHWAHHYPHHIGEQSFLIDTESETCQEGWKEGTLDRQTQGYVWAPYPSHPLYSIQDKDFYHVLSNDPRCWVCAQLVSVCQPRVRSFLLKVHKLPYTYDPFKWSYKARSDEEERFFRGRRKGEENHSTNGVFVLEKTGRLGSTTLSFSLCFFHTFSSLFLLSAGKPNDPFIPSGVTGRNQSIKKKEEDEPMPRMAPLRRTYLI